MLLDVFMLRGCLEKATSPMCVLQNVKLGENHSPESKNVASVCLSVRK